jgi:hypothetical protein
MNFYKQNSNENVMPDLLGKTCDNNGEEYEFKDKIRMRIKISRKNETIISEDFFNQIFLPNLVLKKTEIYSPDKLNIKTIKDSKLDIYNIEIFFDSSEIPFWIKNYKSFDNEFIGWVIKIHSTNKINFYVDTIKEDTENFIKDNWEVEEPGRKDLAKLARKKFLVFNKKKNGDLITFEEEEILNIPRKKKMKFKVIEEKEEKEEKEENDKSFKDEGFNLNTSRNEYLKSKN